MLQCKIDCKTKEEKRAHLFHFSDRDVTLVVKDGSVLSE